MGMMSWSDDTRCLYCEGRLPLYRKVTHGQFCSNAHRKAYWQDQERLAIERLHQTHNTIRSYNAQTQAEAGEELSARLELRPEPVRALPDPEPVLAPEEAPLTVPDMIGLMVPDFLPRGGSLAEMVAADPFEYDFATQPLPPSPVWSAQETNPLPEGHPFAAWATLVPLQWIGQTAGAGAEEECEVAICHPRSEGPAVRMGAAGRIALPLTARSEAGRTAAPVESALLVLEMEPAPVTSVSLEVRPQNDVLVQLLDQQVPHPDRLLSLNQFAALASALESACRPQEPIDAPARTILPAAALAALRPDYQLSGSGMLPLSNGATPAQGSFVRLAAISEISADPQAAIFALAMPAAEVPAYQVGISGLQSLSAGLLSPAPGVLALPTTDSMALDLPAGASSNVTLPTFTAMPAVEKSGYQVGTAGLQKLPSSLLHPVPGVFALSATASVALDLSTGVSSDVTLPSFARGTVTTAAPRLARILPLTFGKRKVNADAPRPEPAARLIPQTAEGQVVLPHSGLEPLDRKPPEDALRNKGMGLGALLRGDGLGRMEPVWAHATGFWHHAPRDLKLLLFAIPALLALVFHPGLPRVAFAAPQSAGGLSSSFKRVLNDQWAGVRQTLESRAAIALDEDFRSGLDNWASPGGSTAEWSFDSTGFVKPGPLALYRPSVNLADYQVQFLGLIDKKALSWVVRAADFENFYVVKMVMLKSGPIPEIGLTRYAVIHGKSQDRHDVHIPLSLRTDTLYRVRMDVQGSNFSVEVQGQMADSWTETRLPRGGVGFFTARGEDSRVRWVQITHQYDMLGRLCAYLAPYDTTNGSWQP